MRISLAIDVSPEVVVRNQNALLFICPTNDLRIRNTWGVVVHRKHVVPPLLKPTGNGWRRSGAETSA
jgi:hypothetical protein